MVISAAFLVVAVACVWLGCLGFVRLTSAYDRLHCVTFAAVAAGGAVLLASWADLGMSPTMLKILFLLLYAVVNGAALGHATGRAILHRERSSQS
jgi:multisubunit Na+/H+ antiporter MnhG subunit